MKILIVLSLIVMFSNSLKLEQLKNIHIINLERDVDLTGRYTKSETKFTIFNEGIVPMNKFYVTIPTGLSNKLYHINLQDQDTDKPIPTKYVEDLDALKKFNATIIEFQLNDSVEEGAKNEFILTEYYYNRFDCLPKKITISDDQFVLYEDSIYFYTPYFVENQITRYQANKILSYTYSSNVVERGALLEYGPFQDVKPFSLIMTTIHQENNTPLVVFKKVTKVIEVSHWGNIAISEHYSIANEGAELTGEFGRVLYNKYNPHIGKNALKELDAVLPFKTWGVYYRDEIGNISTSNAVRGQVAGSNQKQVALNIRPRFGILGGWRSNWEIGYNIPTSSALQQLYSDTTVHILQQQFGFSISDMIAENYTLKVILPEGATDIKYEIPFEIDEKLEDLTFSYLDTTGRPTLIFKKKLVSGYLGQNFKIRYRFNSIQIFREPLMILSGFLIFFMSVIILSRLELVTFKLKNN